MFLCLERFTMLETQRSLPSLSYHPYYCSLVYGNYLISNISICVSSSAMTAIIDVRDDDKE